MGIDIYAEWRGQTKKEKEKQYTGFSVTSGDVGYLREAYHGGPYVTKYLVAEAFASDDATAEIPASILRSRLATAVLMALYRNKVVYQQEKDPAHVEMDELFSKLKDTFASMSDVSHETFAEQVTPLQLSYAEKMIAEGLLPDYAQAFVDFVNVCDKYEQLSGNPCEIHASY